jgi:peptidoglycan DL-endopeptidase CwlO
VRDGIRRLRAGLWIAAAAAAAVSATVAVATAGPGAGTEGATRHHPAGTAGGPSGSLADYARLLAAVGDRTHGNAIAEAAAARARLGETEAVAAQDAGVVLPPGSVLLPGSTPSGAPTVPAGGTSGASAGAGPGSTGAAGAGQQLAAVGGLYPADLFVVAAQTLPASVVSAIGQVAGVTQTNQLDAARLNVNGVEVATLGVDPATFRQFAASPTATSTALWQNVADGDIAVSYLMGQQQHISLGGTVTVTGTQTEGVPVGGFGTIGISGVDAVVSDSVASSLGMPSGNALVVSAPHARLSEVMSAIRSLLPAGAAVAPLVGQAPETGQPAVTGQAGGEGISAADGPGLTVAQTRAFLAAALSRVGMLYVWGGAGPTVFDCSGLVQWSMRQAGIAMPRVAAQQALTGPSVPVADLQPGDLLFYHTDPTAPDYISHVAIYLGDGLMVQAPEPGKDVEVVPADFGAGFAGAVQVYPRVAAALASQTAG